MSALFTVVIPTYNSSDYILDTIKSISLATKTKDYEIIIVDDCSHDIKKLIEIIEPIKNITLIQKNSKTNAADSRNIGYSKATSRFVFLLDSDDSYLLNAIDERINFHEQTQAGIVFGNYITNFGKYTLDSNLPLYKAEDFRSYLFENKGDIRSSVISIDNRYFKGTLFDKESYKHQDWIFSIRCWNNNEQIAFDERYLTIINVSRNTRMSSSFNIEASRYFCENYLNSKQYINAFSEKNWRALLLNGDKEASNFFLSIYKPSEIKSYFKWLLYKIATSSFILPYSKLIANSLRSSKQSFNKYRRI
ncbi:glycosyltransferase family 2 protein [Psychrobacter raelei]|uniref:glycosyltransferase family 2 protein n=1 Tax=Psychrobacter raelei TaxID=2565531 RepID=UPI003F5E9781